MIEIVQTQSVQTFDNGTQKLNLENYYHITKVTEVELMTVKEAMHLLAAKYQTGIDAHSRECSPNICGQYAEPKEGQTCSEDLMFLHDQMAKIHQWIYSVEELGL